AVDDGGAAPPFSLRTPPLNNMTPEAVEQTTKAIENFQRTALKVKAPDGRVDPNGPTHRKLKDLAKGAHPASIGVTQVAPAAETAAHSAQTEVVLPQLGLKAPGPGFRFRQVTAKAEIHELLFKVQKGGRVFWVGAAVPKGTTDFTRTQILFHPTVRQQEVVIARDEDYEAFEGEWSNRTATKGGSIQRYVALQGVQLAFAQRSVPMLVPFTTQAALAGTKGLSDANLFKDRPLETLNAVMAAVQKEITGTADPKPTLSQLGVASFSSGIHALKLFLFAIAGSGSRLVKEVLDLDGQNITSEPKQLTHFGRAVARCYTQSFPKVPELGYVVVTKEHFERVTEYGHYPEGPKRNVRLHARIGWMMYHQAMLDSVIK
ncbi:MAG TPA: hypothetical protein VM597_39110, partial [Gemmataceae bacterium]|nr:hypothetical protein [Gemmataceae bacterium]